jgi:hypothetical protein
MVEHTNIPAEDFRTAANTERTTAQATFEIPTASRNAEADSVRQAESLGAKIGQAAEAGAERNWVSKLFRNAEGEVHGGKVAAWTAAIAAAGAGIYALSHRKKEEERRAEVSSSTQISS